MGFFFVSFIIFSAAFLAAGYYVYRVPQQQAADVLGSRLRELRARNGVRPSGRGDLVRRDIMLDVVRRTAEVVFMPLTVGGGIRNVDDIRALLNAGTDKVSINSAAVKDPSFVSQAARRFGAQCIVVNIDPKRVQRDGKEFWEVHVNGGRIGTGLEAVAWAREVERLGAGEIVLTSMDADGTKAGYDLPMTRAVAFSLASLISTSVKLTRIFLDTFWMYVARISAPSTSSVPDSERRKSMRIWCVLLGWRSLRPQTSFCLGFTKACRSPNEAFRTARTRLT